MARPKHTFSGVVRRRCLKDLPVDGTLDIEFPKVAPFPTTINSVVTSLKDAVGIAALPKDAGPEDPAGTWLSLSGSQIAVITYRIWDDGKVTERHTTVHFGPNATIPYVYVSGANAVYRSKAESGYIITLK